MSEKSAFDLIKGNQTIYCGLTVGEFIKLLDYLQGIWHGVDEDDWDRLGKLEETFSEIEALAVIMENHKCTCPPHGLIDPTIVARTLKINVENKKRAEALSNISQLLFSLLEAGRYDLVKSILPTKFLT